MSSSSSFRRVVPKDAPSIAMPTAVRLYTWTGACRIPVPIALPAPSTVFLQRPAVAVPWSAGRDHRHYFNGVAESTAESASTPVPSPHMPISVVGSQHVTPRSMGSGIGEVPGAGDASPPWRIGVVTPPSSPAHELLPATDNDVPHDFDDSIAISDDMLLTRFRTDVDNSDTVQGGCVARIAAQVDAVANANSGGLAAANPAPAPDPATAPAHVCKFCRAAFADKTSLGRHLREHSGEKPWICTWDGCTKRFSHQEPLKRHQRTHTGEKPYTCSVCQKGFSQSTHRTVHMRSHTGERPYSCPICSRAFAHKSHVKRHARVHRQRQADSLRCSLCNEEIESAALFSIHMQMHQVLSECPQPPVPLLPV
ncbi:C2H2-type domain-containing protein [Plasmodiophora brassicae]